VDALKDFEGTMIFVSHDRMFLRGLGSRVLELGGESGTDRHPTVYPGSYVEYVQKLGHEAPGIYSWDSASRCTKARFCAHCFK
jgi:ATPase subunit of ABC transporter with duplicated ATPase domains